MSMILYHSFSISPSQEQMILASLEEDRNRKRARQSEESEMRRRVDEMEQEELERQRQVEKERASQGTGPLSFFFLLFFSEIIIGVTPETLYHRDGALLYIAYVMLTWAAPIPADRWHCSLWA